MATRSKPKSPLDLLIEHFRTKAAIARALNAGPMTVQQWFNRERIPPKWAKEIEKYTHGALTREQLCPEFFEAA